MILNPNLYAIGMPLTTPRTRLARKVELSFFPFISQPAFFIIENFNDWQKLTKFLLYLSS